MQALLSYMGIGFLWLVSLLPLWFLYIISDLFYLVIRLVGYRKGVIDDNLKYSFPDMSEKERNRIRNKFLRYFCDLFIETIKTRHLSVKEIKRRVKFNNIEYCNKIFNEDKEVIAAMAHYCNWEWISSINLHSKALGCAVYRPLKNKPYDKYMLKLRSRWGSLNFTMKNTLRDVIKLRKENTRMILGLIADQSPGKPEIQYWTTFLNQKTPVLTGPEKIAKLTKSPVVYLDMKRIKRGYYEVDIVPLVEDSENSAEHEITNKYNAYLEKVIRREPQFWLWSHRRWKYSDNRLVNSNEKHIS